MRLAKLSEYRRIIYTLESAPTFHTLRSHIDAGKIPGGQVLHGRYFVDMDELDKATNLRANIIAQQKAIASHPLMEGLV